MVRFPVIILLLSLLLPLGMSDAYVAPSSNEDRVASDTAGKGGHWEEEPVPLNVGDVLKWKIEPFAGDPYQVNLTVERDSTAVRMDGQSVEAFSIHIDRTYRNSFGDDLGEMPATCGVAANPAADLWFAKEGPRFLSYRLHGPREPTTEQCGYGRAQTFPSVGLAPIFLPQIEPAAFVWLTPFHLGFRNATIPWDEGMLTQTIGPGAPEGMTVHVESIVGTQRLEAEMYYLSGDVPTRGNLTYSYVFSADPDVRYTKEWSFRLVEYIQGTPKEFQLSLVADEIRLLQPSSEYIWDEPWPRMEMGRPGGFTFDLDESLQRALTSILAVPEASTYALTAGPLVAFVADWQRYPIFYAPEGSAVPQPNHGWTIYIGRDEPPGRGNQTNYQVHWVYDMGPPSLEHRVVLALGHSDVTTFGGGDVAASDRPEVIGLRDLLPAMESVPGMDRSVDRVAWRAEPPYRPQADSWILGTGCDRTSTQPSTVFVVRATTGLIEHGFFNETYGPSHRCDIGYIPPLWNN